MLSSYSCYGAGFGLSRKLLDCAVDNYHITDFRFAPSEDVSVGILSERCGYKPTRIPGINIFRTDKRKEVKCSIHGIPLTECFKDDPEWPPAIKMDSTIVQHHVETRDDMNYLHNVVLQSK